MADNTQYQDPQGELDVPEQPLPGDYDTPAAPADDTSKEAKNVPPDHPDLDTDVDEHDAYDAGLANASGVNDQHEEDEDHGQMQEED